MEKPEKNDATVTWENLIDLEWEAFQRLRQELKKAKSDRKQAKIVQDLIVHARILADLLKEYDENTRTKKSLEQLLSRIPEKHHKTVKKFVFKTRLVHG